MARSAPTDRRTTTQPGGGDRVGARVPAVCCRDLTKAYGRGEATVTALDHVDLDIEPARFTAVMGPSGSGKSTLLHCLAGLDGADAGQVLIGDQDISGLPDAALTRVRREKVGFVFQAFNLLPTLTAEQNIRLPLDLSGRRADPGLFDQVVDVLGLRDRLGHRPSQLSGGQQQRVAVARALVTRPHVVFADEPTGNLDSRSGTALLAFLRRSVDELGQTVVMVTHDPTAAATADRVVMLSDGRVAGEMAAPSVADILRMLTELEG